jgi:hypothetical protein
MGPSRRRGWWERSGRLFFAGSVLLGCGEPAVVADQATLLSPGGSGGGTPASPPAGPGAVPTASMVCPSQSSYVGNLGWMGPGGVGSIYALVVTKADPSGPCFIYSGGQAPPAPARYLIAANRPITCEQTLPSGMLAALVDEACVGPTPPTWEICIGLSAAQVTPSVVDLTRDPFLRVEQEVNCIAWGTAGQCDTTGSDDLAQGGPASLTITSVNASSVAFTIDDSTIEVGNGDYTATVCP